MSVIEWGVFSSLLIRATRRKRLFLWPYVQILTFMHMEGEADYEQSCSHNNTMTHSPWSDLQLYDEWFLIEELTHLFDKDTNKDSSKLQMNSWWFVSARQVWDLSYKIDSFKSLIRKDWN